MNVNLCVGEGVYLQLQFQFYFPYLNYKFLHTNKTLEGDQLDGNSIFFLHVNVRKMFAVKKREGGRGGGGGYRICNVLLYSRSVH